jgi:CRP/FNR family cyclic AMP-dependent transcriptional regulator
MMSTLMKSEVTAIPNQLLPLQNAGARAVEFNAGQVIHGPNDSAEAFYFIESGEVRLYDVIDGNSERLLDILGPNGWLGVAALGNYPVYKTRAVAETRSILWSLPTANLRKVLIEHGEIGLQIMQSLARRLTEAWTDGSRMVFDDCRQRLIQTLVRFSKTPAARPTAEGTVLRITHKQLAQAVGAARETVSVCLTELRNKNFVRTGRNQLIFDPEQLARLDRA